MNNRVTINSLKNINIKDLFTGIKITVNFDHQGLCMFFLGQILRKHIACFPGHFKSSDLISKIYFRNVILSSQTVNLSEIRSSESYFDDVFVFCMQQKAHCMLSSPFEVLKLDKKNLVNVIFSPQTVNLSEIKSSKF